MTLHVSEQDFTEFTEIILKNKLLPPTDTADALLDWYCLYKEAATKRSGVLAQTMTELKKTFYTFTNLPYTVYDKCINLLIIHESGKKYLHS